LLDSLLQENRILCLEMITDSIIFLFVGILISSVVGRKLENRNFQGDDEFSFEDFITSKFSARSFNGSWWSKNELQWSDVDGNLVAWNFEEDTSSIIVSADLLQSVASNSKFEGFSGDASMLLFAYDIDAVWRHSFTATYLVLDSVNNKNITVRSGSGGTKLQYCAWIKNTENKNSLIYVFENNIYVRENALVEDDIAITTDGVIDNVFNGIPDWVYEEEVLGVNYANHMSPTGHKIAFARFNDTLVPEFQYPHYGNPDDVFHNQYPTYKKVRYPKSGETNPTINLFVYDLPQNLRKEVKPPTEVEQWDEYIYAKIYWVHDTKLSVTWMNRVQNSTVLSTCLESESSWNCETVKYFEESNGWMDPATPVLYSPDGDVITIWSKLENNNLHYPHIVKIDTDNNMEYLSEGQIVVIDILAWDDNSGTVYFMGTKEGSAGSRHLYTVDDKANKMITCLTCDIPSLSGDVCEYNEVSLSSDNKYFIHKCRGEVIPEVNLRLTSDSSTVYILEDNADLKDRLTFKSLPTINYLTVPVGDGFEAPVKMYIPPDFDPAAKYPMILYIYGGPGAQQVTARWTLGWESYLTSSKDIVYVLMDGRGTGFQSNEYKFQVYRNLGTVEMDDQISVTRKLTEMFDYIDKDRVGIWGWSYGGFNTAMTLERDVQDPVFACGISVAPVTSWLLYDSIYTERFMSLPEDNQAGYNNSVIAGIESLRGKKWMLNHGVADDNVHYQHSMLLTRALEVADIQFEQHSYADENHSLRGVSRFLYHAMRDFWERCFNLA